MKRLRDRRAAGLRRFEILVDEAAVEDALIERGYLSSIGADDPSAVQAALERAVEDWLRM